jgi:hypothetical protein
MLGLPHGTKIFFCSQAVIAMDRMKCCPASRDC